MMSAGVISFEPSQLIPFHGLANVCDPIAVRYVPAATFENVNVPSAALVADWTVWPLASRSCTVTPGSPSSPFSTLPGTPPPGLKSRQTTPTTSPAFGAGDTACFALLGTSAGGIAVSPSRATPPGASGVLSTSVPDPVA